MSNEKGGCGATTHRPSEEEIEDLALRLEIDYREHRYQNCQRAASMLRRLVPSEIESTKEAFAKCSSCGAAFDEPCFGNCERRTPSAAGKMTNLEAVNGMTRLWAVAGEDRDWFMLEKLGDVARSLAAKLDALESSVPSSERRTDLDATALEFWRKHALGSKLCPSCLACGHQAFDRADWWITHGELPDVYICKGCVEKLRAPVSAIAVTERCRECGISLFGRNHRGTFLCAECEPNPADSRSDR